MMKSTKNQGILLGVGMLGIGLAAGFAPQASAQSRVEVREDRRDVRQAERNVREQRRDVQRANTPAKRAEQREQLRDARSDLRNERQDLRQKLQQRNGYNSNTRYLPNGRVNPNYRYNGNTRYVPNTGYSGKNRYNNAQTFRTVEGIVTSDFRGNGFVLRTFNGQQLSVQVRGGEPRRISRGDRVRVYGSYIGGAFRAQNLTIVRNR